MYLAMMCLNRVGGVVLSSLPEEYYATKKKSVCVLNFFCLSRFVLNTEREGGRVRRLNRAGQLIIVSHIVRGFCAKQY